ncbi:hypothetical protein GCM10009745_69200 [Kribbella yunnanensis]|uniref:DUF222 domain-containing protein n=1 Tax=Kribbella yunnanensis TaxID=190194 RepID=A0ABN2IT56_9ACTN
MTVRISASSFPTPDLVKTTNNPAQWDQLDRFAAVQAEAANGALESLGERLASASTVGDRAAAFEGLYRQLAEWRYRLAVEGRVTRPSSNAETIRTPIGEGSMSYRLSPSVAGRESGSPAHRALTKMERVALEQFSGSADRVQHQVALPDGRTVNGNLLMRTESLGEQAADVFGRSTEEMAAAAPAVAHDETITVTASQGDREVLRRAAFEQLAGLETKRAEAGGLDPHDPENRQAFADATYCLFQGPEFRRGTDATMRVFVAAAHARVFDAAPVVPQGVDLDAMVRDQQGFRDTMRDEMRVISGGPTAGQERSASAGERAAGARDQGRGSTGIQR